MNNIISRSNDVPRGERPLNADERPHAEASAVAFEFNLGDSTSYRTESRRVTAAIILIFWLLQYGIVSLNLFLMDSPGQGRLFLPRAFSAGVGVLISFAMVAVQNRLRESSLSLRAAVAGAMAVIGTVIHSVTSVVIFQLVLRTTTPILAQLSEIGQDTIYRLWIFISLSAIILALSYAADIRDREMRIRLLQALAHSAQVRALRNQLNPHFLFNSLNSIAGLISAKRVSEAEAMTENLADFLRLMLAQDPQKLITLNEELQLQGLYLDIEQVRFPGRLDVKVDAPSEARNALVPSLITQPLIENSIKYAVARSTRPVELRIIARIIGDRLELMISDSGGNADGAPSKGAQLGLRNVTERVRMHYGEEGRFLAKANPAGGFQNVITIPLKVQE